MEGISANMSTKARRYWRRRGYQKINESSRRRWNQVELGSASTGRTRFWRIKIKPKLKIFRMASPKKFFVWLRDAYVKMMLGLANSRVIGPRAADFRRGPLKEYDEKMIIEIYKSMVIGQGQIVPRDAARFGSVSRLAAIVE